MKILYLQFVCLPFLIQFARQINRDGKPLARYILLQFFRIYESCKQNKIWFSARFYRSSWTRGLCLTNLFSSATLVFISLARFSDWAARTFMVSRTGCWSICWQSQDHKVNIEKISKVFWLLFLCCLLLEIRLLTIVENSTSCVYWENYYSWLSKIIKKNIQRECWELWWHNIYLYKRFHAWTKYNELIATCCREESCMQINITKLLKFALQRWKRNKLLAFYGGFRRVSKHG